MRPTYLRPHASRLRIFLHFSSLIFAICDSSCSISFSRIGIAAGSSGSRFSPAKRRLSRLSFWLRLSSFFLSFLSMISRFDFLEEIRLIARNESNRFGWTRYGNRALITLFTQILVDLQVKRTVSERATTFDAFATADAKVRINDVLKRWVFDVRARNRGSRANLHICAGIERRKVGFWQKVTSA